MIIYSTYIQGFIFNNFILARPLWRAHKLKKIQFSLKNIIFAGFGEVGGVYLFSSILIQSQWFKMIIYSIYIEVFIFNNFILARALYRARIHSRKFNSRDVGVVSIFSWIFIQSQWFKKIMYSTYIAVFIFNFIVARALCSTRINSQLSKDFTLSWLCALALLFFLRWKIDEFDSEKNMGED